MHAAESSPLALTAPATPRHALAQGMAQDATSTHSLAALERSARSLQEAAQSLEEAVESLKQQKTVTSPAQQSAALPWQAVAAPARAGAALSGPLPWQQQAEASEAASVVTPASAEMTDGIRVLPRVNSQHAVTAPAAAPVAQAAQAPATISAPMLAPSAGAASSPLAMVQDTPAPASATMSEKPALAPVREATGEPAPAVASAVASVPVAEQVQAPAIPPAHELPGIALADDPFTSIPAVKYSVITSFLKHFDGIVSLNVGQYARAASVLEPIRMDEAVAFALKNNLEIKAGHSTTKSAQLEKMTAYSRMLPSVDVKFSRGKEQSAPASYNDVFGNRVLNDKHTRTDRMLAVSQPLIDLEVVAEILNSTDKESLIKNQAAAERDGIAYDTISAYLRLVQSKIAYDLAGQYRTRLNELSDYMATRVEVGGATVGDLERIKVHASNAEAAQAEAQGEYETSLAEFRRLTQITPAQLAAISITVPDVPVSLDEALQAAIRQNPDYIVSRNKVDIADSTRNNVFSKAVPKLGLEYSDTDIYNAGGAANGNPVDGVYPSQRDKRLMLVARWTLNGGMEIGSGLTAIEKSKEARLRSLDVKSRLEEAMVASYNSIHAADQRIGLMRDAIAASEKVVVEFTDQYKNGSRSIFELLDAHGQLYNNRMNMMRMEVTRIMAAYQVHRQMGDLVPLLVAQHTRNTQVAKKD